MKIGYSILLGEYINSENINYNDCKSFQIICPTCKEPIFKVEKNMLDQKIHYLSHYKQSEYESDCELRSSSLSKAVTNEHNSKSRNQKLDFFLKVFSTMLEAESNFSYEKSFESSQKRMNKSKAWRFLRGSHFTEAKKNKVYDVAFFKECADFYVSGFVKDNEDFETSFSIETQTRIANDMMAFLCTEKGRENYFKLYNHAAICLIARCSNPANPSDHMGVGVLKNISGYMVEIMVSGEKKGMRVLNDMASHPINPPYMSSPSNYLHKVTSEIAHEMIGVLIRLPYFEFLKTNNWLYHKEAVK